MTTDREMLELAAKAAVVDGQWADFPGMDIRVGYQGGIHDGNEYWNPLHDDGDALRLAVKLGFDIRPYTKISTVYVWSHAADKWIGEFYGASNDPYAATRRAIVRAAAEIGRGMK